MRAVGLKVLKNKLSEYVRLAERGETILVTDRDRIVAELRPPGQERSSRVADAFLAEVVRKGWITPPIFRGSEPCPRSPVAPWNEIRAELARDREDR